MVVVGGGIAGVSVAYELAERASVVLVEQEAQLAHHTTGRSAAMYLSSYGGPVVRALTAASRADFDDLAARLDTPPLLAERSLLWVSDAAGLPHLDGLLDGGAVLDRLSVDEALAECPVLRPERLAGVARDPGAWEIDVLALHQAYVRGVRGRGGEIVRSAPAAVSRDGSGWRVVAGERTIAADVVVVAAGAWTDLVAAGAGLAPVGLRPLRRTLVTSPVHRDEPVDRWPLVADVADRFYFKPEGPDQVLLSPADETPSEPCDARPEEEDVALALERVNEATTLALRSVRAAWAGLRTFTDDRSPVVGWRPGEEGFCWFAGQGGYGIQMAPALARTAASLVLDGAVPVDVAALGVSADDLSPERFPA